MANTTYNIRIDSRIRQEADALFRSMGLSLSSAVNLFLTQSVAQGKLPLTEIVGAPFYAGALLRDAAETDAALAEGAVKTYATPDELFSAWENSDG